GPSLSMVSYLRVAPLLVRGSHPGRIAGPSPGIRRARSSLVELGSWHSGLASFRARSACWSSPSRTEHLWKVCTNERNPTRHPASGASPNIQCSGNDPDGRSHVLSWPSTDTARCCKPADVHMRSAWNAAKVADLS